MDSARREMILRIVKEITSSTVENKEEYFAEKYENFKTKYPVLYDVACRPGIDMANLEYMINLLGKMHDHRLSQHDASVNVGQMLYDKYIDGMVKTKE